MDCPECGAFNSSLDVECADCGADLSGVDAAAQRKHRRRGERVERREELERAEERDTADAQETDFAAAPNLKVEALLGGLLLGVGVMLRPVYYAYQQYVLMDALASLGGFGVSGGTLEPMVVEILVGFTIAYVASVSALRKPAVMWWVFALSVAFGAWLATRNHLKPDGMLMAAVACVVASLFVLAHAQHGARQLRRG